MKSLKIGAALLLLFSSPAMPACKTSISLQEVASITTKASTLDTDILDLRNGYTSRVAANTLSPQERLEYSLLETVEGVISTIWAQLIELRVLVDVRDAMVAPVDRRKVVDAIEVVIGTLSSEGRSQAADLLGVAPTIQAPAVTIEVSQVVAMYRSIFALGDTCKANVPN